MHLIWHPLRGHGAVIAAFHLLLPFAISFASPLMSVLYASSPFQKKILRLIYIVSENFSFCSFSQNIQVFFGFLRFRCPCRFHSKACIAMLLCGFLRLECVITSSTPCFDCCFYWLLFGDFPQVCVGDFIRPSLHRTRTDFVMFLFSFQIHKGVLIGVK